MYNKVIPNILIHKIIMYICFMNSKLFRGSLETIILELLNRYGQMYGYEITQKVKELSDGDIMITEGALYPALHKLERKNLLSSQIESICNRKRKYYSLTETGKKETQVQVSEMQNFITNLNLIFNPQLSSYAISKYRY